MGVEAIEVGTIKMNLGAEPTVIYKAKTKKESVNSQGVTSNIQDAAITTDGLTEEQLLMWSVQGPQLEAPPEQQ